MCIELAFALIPTQQEPRRRPCWCSRQKSLIKILLNWNTNMAAVTLCANALYLRQNLYVRSNSIAATSLSPFHPHELIPLWKRPQAKNVSTNPTTAEKKEPI